MSIYKVNSNLNHNGVQYAPGTLIEGTDAEFSTLVTDNVLSLVEGAKSMSEARRIIALDEEKAQQEEASDEKVSPKDTWGAQPDPVKPAEEKVEQPPADNDHVVPGSEKFEEKPKVEVGTGDQPPAETGDNL